MDTDLAANAIEDGPCSGIRSGFIRIVAFRIRRLAIVSFRFAPFDLTCNFLVDLFIVIDLSAFARCRGCVENRLRVEDFFNVQDDQQILLAPDDTLTESPQCFT